MVSNVHPFPQELSPASKKLTQKAFKRIMTSLDMLNGSARQENEKKSSEAFEEGKIFLLDKKYQEATKKFTVAIRLNKFNVEAKFLRGVSFLDASNLKKAISVQIIFNNLGI
jgi:hypothetical protein